MKKELVYISILLIAGCAGVTSPKFEPELVVFSLLMAGNQIPHIKLEQSWSIEEELPEQGLGMTDAEVEVSTKDTVVSYVPLDDTSGWYIPSITSMEVLPLETYQLRVVTKDSMEIFAETTVPDTFSIVSPQEGDTIYKDSLSYLTWKKSANAAGYLIAVPFPDTFRVTITVSANDSIFPILSFFLSDTGQCVIKVAALDRNYYDYISEGSSQGVGVGVGVQDEDTTYMQGGLGVFGSCAVDSVRIYVK